MRPGVVLGRARIGLFLGLGIVVVGLTFGSAVTAWSGVVVVGSAVLANVIGKVAHFRELPLSPTVRTRLAALWLFLAIGMVALLADAVAVRTVDGYVGAFWPLVFVVGVLGIGYRIVQSRYLDEEMEPAD